MQISLKAKEILYSKKDWPWHFQSWNLCALSSPHWAWHCRRESHLLLTLIVTIHIQHEDDIFEESHLSAWHCPPLEQATAHLCILFRCKASPILRSVICKSLRPSWRKWRENIFWKDVPPGVEENDGKKRDKEVEEGGGQHHVQGVACELLLLINIDLKEKKM